MVRRDQTMANIIRWLSSETTEAAACTTPIMIERITDGPKELAMVLRSSHRRDGIEFFTPNDYSQQLGYMNRPKGYVIAPHVHHSVAREVHFTQEVLFIRSGRVRVDFYSQQKLYLHSTILECGDVILLAEGGHGFEMLEPSELIEVKQGPYCGQQDKSSFEGIRSDQVALKP